MDADSRNILNLQKKHNILWTPCSICSLVYDYRKRLFILWHSRPPPILVTTYTSHSQYRRRTYERSEKVICRGSFMRFFFHVPISLFYGNVLNPSSLLLWYLITFFVFHSWYAVKINCQTKNTTNQPTKLGLYQNVARRDIRQGLVTTLPSDNLSFKVTVVLKAKNSWRWEPWCRRIISARGYNWHNLIEQGRGKWVAHHRDAHHLKTYLKQHYYIYLTCALFISMWERIFICPLIGCLQHNIGSQDNGN